jgi:hypothetical protein
MYYMVYIPYWIYQKKNKNKKKYFYAAAVVVVAGATLMNGIAPPV